MKKIFKIKGMHCNSCSQSIENKLKDKVNKVSASYSKGQVEVDFNSNKISEKRIKEIIKETGYECWGVNEIQKETPKASKKKIKAIYWHIGFLSIMVLLVLFVFLRKYGVELHIPEFNFTSLGSNASLFLLFFAGLLTGFHCIAMCGGFLVSYTAKNAIKGHKSFKQHLIYGASKTVSYTIIVALFGLIGSIFLFTPALRGGVAIFAGVFMIAFSLSMMGIKFFRRFQFNPKFLTKISTKRYSGMYFGPMMTGLLNGLFIACGPLQALYIYAAGTGSPIQGGLSLMVFGLGTLPVMLGFGGFANVISHKATRKILKISAIIVLILGLIMLNRGLALTGSGYDVKSISTGIKGVEGIGGNLLIEDGYQIINMDVNRYGWSPDQFVLKKDIPVKWIINGKEITGCNNAIQVPKLGLNFDIEQGEQIIEFTPTEEGVISWSCWMGMIPGTFIVTDDGVASQKEIKSASELAAASGGSCGGGAGGGSCGSPTCGASQGTGGCGCGG
jgi:sulfite exporter TauE/SafE/copper chaperone CopZ